ncbi:hypothetical protein R80B4_01427 [Fibrobacteres bacterium R8-0-B4]
MPRAQLRPPDGTIFLYTRQNTPNTTLNNPPHSFRYTDGCTVSISHSIPAILSEWPTIR